MDATTTTPMLECPRLCINSEADPSLWSATITVMLGRSRGSGMVIAVDMGGFSHIFAYCVHMRAEKGRNGTHQPCG